MEVPPAVARALAVDHHFVRRLRSTPGRQPEGVELLGVAPVTTQRRRAVHRLTDRLAVLPDDAGVAEDGALRLRNTIDARDRIDQ